MAMAAGKRQKNLRGKRTGIQIPESNGEDDMDRMFEGVSSPPAANDGNDGTGSVEYLVTEERSTRKKKKLRFSLDTEASSRDADGDRTDVTRLVSGLQRAGRQSLSPSELSKVSTAPPSFDRSTLAHFDEEDEEIGRALQEQRGDDDEFSPLLKAKIGEDILELPITQEDMDGDDMVPPAPDDNTDTEEENPDFFSPKTPSRSVAPAEQTPGEVLTATANLEDTDDEDDKEGDGFQLSENNHQTPEPSTQSSSESSRKEVKQKKKNKNGKAAPEESSVREGFKPLKKPKKKLKNSTFSPKGTQSGPLTYKHIVPVTDPKDEAATGLRRSQRMRIAPLAFWKNEGADYVPNDFDDELIDGLETMPVVKAFRVAEKTPYKKRNAPVSHHQDQQKKSKKSVSSKASKAEETEFDTSKLKKKYKYNEKDTAFVWDDCYERAEELGKMILSGYKLIKM